MRSLPVLLLLLFLLAACEMPVTGPSAGALPSDGGVATASVITVVPAVTSGPGLVADITALPATPAPPTPLPTLASATLTPTELKYRVLNDFPGFFYCDPDYYPVAREDEGQVAIEILPELRNNQEEFQAILEQLGLGGTSSFTDEQKLLIYREHKKLAALHFDVVGGQYHFQITVGDQAKAENVQGVIDGSGRITVRQQTPGFATCPICLAAHTLIDTPKGGVAVEQVRPGDVIWTVGASGQRVAQRVLRVARVPVSQGHVLIHVKLDDGRELWASPGHPTADGRVLAALRAGDMLDGARVVQAESISYEDAATYDVLPAGATGFYWANGILMGSTLHP